jgi:hypothetical protein
MQWPLHGAAGWQLDAFEITPDGKKYTYFNPTLRERVIITRPENWLRVSQIDGYRRLAPGYVRGCYKAVERSREVGR